MSDIGAKDKAAQIQLTLMSDLSAKDKAALHASSVDPDVRFQCEG